MADGFCVPTFDRTTRIRDYQERFSLIPIAASGIDACACCLSESSLGRGDTHRQETEKLAARNAQSGIISSGWNACSTKFKNAPG